jgi:hypothetical protein
MGLRQGKMIGHRRGAFSIFRPAAQAPQTSSSMHWPQAILPHSLHVYSFFEGLLHRVHMPVESMIYRQNGKINRCLK